jgi:Predicted nucleotide-binding protein containing TIR-like domain
MSSHQLPRVFIGSSVEALSTAYTLQTSLEFDSEPTVWTQGIFKPSSNTLKDLMLALGRFDFAVFVFNADDVLSMRSQTMNVVRDNVVFELGLFIGSLGMERCFMLKARGSENLHLPSDLMGWQALEFNANRSDHNLLAALGPAAHLLRGEFARIGKRADFSTEKLHQAFATKGSAVLDRYQKIWHSDVLRSDRERANLGMALNIVEDEDGLDSASLTRLVAFVETLCDSSLRGEIDPLELQKDFGAQINTIYNHARFFWYNAPNGAEPWSSIVIDQWRELLPSSSAL